MVGFAIGLRRTALELGAVHRNLNVGLRYGHCIHARCKTSDTSGSFADRARVIATGGHGGAGCASFARGPNKEIAPPDGGNGGDGGNVWLEACDTSLTLRMSTTQKRALSGTAGQSDLRRGRRGADLTVRVPAGTVAYLLDENGVPGMVVADLDRVGVRACVARGGRGGRGNSTYKASTNRSPEATTHGMPGEETSLLLELKTIADVGLVGVPNAGKSTLLRAMSSARPRVAAYAFTTLRPHIGVVKRGEPSGPGEQERRITVADIPGLVDGAHMDRGLGHEFLRHVERTKALVYVVDVVNADLPSTEALRILEHELELYQTGLSSRVCAVVANKMDKGAEAYDALNEFIAAVGDRFDVFPTAAQKGVGVDELVEHLMEVVEKENMKNMDEDVKDVKREHELWTWENRGSMNSSMRAEQAEQVELTTMKQES